MVAPNSQRVLTALRHDLAHRTMPREQLRAVEGAIRDLIGRLDDDGHLPAELSPADHMAVQIALLHTMASLGLATTEEAELN